MNIWHVHCYHYDRTETVWHGRFTIRRHFLECCECGEFDWQDDHWKDYIPKRQELG